MDQFKFNNQEESSIKEKVLIIVISTFGYLALKASKIGNQIICQE